MPERMERNCDITGLKYSKIYRYGSVCREKIVASCLFFLHSVKRAKGISRENPGNEKKEKGDIGEGVQGLRYENLLSFVAYRRSPWQSCSVDLSIRSRIKKP
jgi:hypothetical protein